MTARPTARTPRGPLRPPTRPSPSAPVRGGKALAGWSLAGLALLVLPACIGVAAGAAATSVVASQEFIDHADAVQLPYQADEVQHATRSVLASMSMDPIEADDEARVCKGYVQGATIYTRVETLDMGRSRLAVGATKWTQYDDEVAQDFIRRVKKRLER